MIRTYLMCVVFIALASGCQPKRSPDPVAPEPVAPVEPDAPVAPVAPVTAPAPSPAPSPAIVEFVSPKHGVRLSYPGEWSPTPSDEYIFRLVRTGNADASISLDVPKLPPHIPGFIPLGMVVDGYIDDLKKKHAGINIERPANTKIAGAKARRVRSTFNSGGRMRVEDAVLTVHGDRVYIFRGNAGATARDKIGEALDGILASVRWQ